MSLPFVADRAGDAKNPDVTKPQMCDYEAEFDRPQPPPNQARFTAISDDHARELMRQRYFKCQWRLYRLTSDGRVPVESFAGEKPRQPGEP